MSRRILILGMGGLFGAAAARAFRAAGWDVDRYRRGSDMSVAARGARWIVNAMNPPGTLDLERELPQMTKEVIKAARNSGASIMAPGNFHVYGKTSTPWGPNCPHSPPNLRARLNDEAEKRYQDAADADRSILLLRAGDFIMPGAQQTLMNKITLSRLHKSEVVALGPAQKRHIHADLEDLTRVAVSLVASADDTSGYFEVPFPGTQFSAEELAQNLSSQMDQKFKVTGYPWWSLALKAPTSRAAREMRSMRYFYQMDHQLDDSAFRIIFPDYETKSLDRIVFEHLYMRGLKVKPEGQAADQSPRAQNHGQAMSTQTIL
ncbi:hypothetical protein ERN12_15100 [Rhodobacteraceae bacterium]|nr:hypothetical protein ERN12_15100 [Paracoccaceae bacterium]